MELGWTQQRNSVTQSLFTIQSPLSLSFGFCWSYLLVYNKTLLTQIQTLAHNSGFLWSWLANAVAAAKKQFFFFFLSVNTILTFPLKLWYNNRRTINKSTSKTITTAVDWTVLKYLHIHLTYSHVEAQIPKVIVFGTGLLEAIKLRWSLVLTW